MPAVKCKQTGCDKTVYFMNLCYDHVAQTFGGEIPEKLKQQHGEDPDKETTPEPTTCKVHQCEKTTYAKGYCHPHYHKLQRIIKDYDDGKYPLRARKAAKGTCEVEDCNRPARTRDMCQQHYTRLLRTGTTKKLDQRNRVTLDYYLRVRELNPEVYDVELLEKAKELFNMNGYKHLNDYAKHVYGIDLTTPATTQ